MWLSGQIGVVLSRPYPGLGVMANPRSLGPGQVGQLVATGTPWAADNDAFTSFDEPRWLDWLTGMPRAARALCLFAAAPDVVGDAVATLARFARYLPLIREMGYPVAYVAQDGFEPGPVPWGEIDWLFIGGTDRFKRAERGGYAAMREGKRRGKRVHVGRVNGGRFLANVAMAGADSADGTKLCFGPDTNYPMVTGWLDQLAVQPGLPLASAGLWPWPDDPERTERALAAAALRTGA